MINAKLAWWVRRAFVRRHSRFICHTRLNRRYNVRSPGVARGLAGSSTTYLRAPPLVYSSWLRTERTMVSLCRASCWAARPAAKCSEYMVGKCYKMKLTIFFHLNFWILKYSECVCYWLGFLKIARMEELTKILDGLRVGQNVGKKGSRTCVTEIENNERKMYPSVPWRAIVIRCCKVVWPWQGFFQLLRKHRGAATTLVLYGSIW